MVVKLLLSTRPAPGLKEAGLSACCPEGPSTHISDIEAQKYPDRTHCKAIVYGRFPTIQNRPKYMTLKKGSPNFWKHPYHIEVNGHTGLTALMPPASLG